MFTLLWRDACYLNKHPTMGKTSYTIKCYSVGNNMSTYHQQQENSLIETVCQTDRRDETTLSTPLPPKKCNNNLETKDSDNVPNLEKRKKKLQICLLIHSTSVVRLESDRGETTKVSLVCARLALVVLYICPVMITGNIKSSTIPDPTYKICVCVGWWRW